MFTKCMDCPDPLLLHNPINFQSHPPLAIFTACADRVELSTPGGSSKFCLATKSSPGGRFNHHTCTSVRFCSSFWGMAEGDVSKLSFLFWCRLCSVKTSQCLVLKARSCIGLEKGKLFLAGFVTSLPQFHTWVRPVQGCSCSPRAAAQLSPGSCWRCLRQGWVHLTAQGCSSPLAQG